MDFDRFDFEQQLLRVWNDDIDTVLFALERNASKQELRLMLEGFQAIQNARCEKLWNMFEAGISNNQIV